MNFIRHILALLCNNHINKASLLCVWTGILYEKVRTILVGAPSKFSNTVTKQETSWLKMFTQDLGKTRALVLGVGK